MIYKLATRGFATSARRLTQLQEVFYNSEQKALQDSVRKLLAEKVEPYAADWERAELFPAKKVFKSFGDAGLLGINKAVEDGGLGLSYRYEVAFLEALGECSIASIPTALGVHTDCSTPPLAKFGTDYIKKTFLAPAITGDAVSCLAVSEPGGGSDVASLKTSARKVGDDYVINGSKMWISNGLQADWICLLVNTSDGKPHLNKSMVIVPSDVKGLSRTKIDKMGIKSSDTAILSFDDVHVPQKNLVGAEGSGFMQQMLQFQEERMAGAVSSLAPLNKLINVTIDYTKERKAFGRPLIKNQYLAYRLAELATEVELLRAGVYQAVTAIEAGENATLLASMLKLKTGRLLREVSDSCLQFWGGMGFTEEVFVSRMYRDGRAGSIAGGADEIMLGIICKIMGIEAKKK